MSSLHIKRFICNAFAENTYVLSHKNQAIIIDPGCSNETERKRIKNHVNSLKCQVIKLINTHAHLDHILGNPWVSKFYQISAWVHENDLRMYQYQTLYAQSLGIDLEPLPTEVNLWKHGQEHEFLFADTIWKVIPTPGHSPGHVCFYNADENCLFSGDLLFSGSIGRTDLPMCDPVAMQKSLATIQLLPEETVIYPGHGPSTTLKYELANNPYLNNAIS